MINIHVYSEQNGLRGMPAGSLKKWDSGSDENIWVDMYQTGDDECSRILSDAFAFHYLAIEDALKYTKDSTVHHPKLDDFGEYIFIVFNGVISEPDSAKLKYFSLSCFLGHNFLVTIHNEKPVNLIEASIKNALTESSFRKGPDYILHLIFDSIVDNYYPILDDIELKITGVEELIFKSDPNNRTLVSILNLKKELVKLIRFSSYQKEVLFKLTRGDSKLISPEESIFYRNVYDHLVRVTDSADSYRDYLTGVLDSYLSIINNRLNETMKFLTTVATIALPLTFITGLFGMNFDNMPFLQHEFGFYVSLVIMAVIVFGMIYWFRKKRMI